jgi:dsRNA-specific ribonuclease
MTQENDILECNDKLIQNDEDIHENENGLIFNPYNPINKEITNNTIQNILTKYGINHKITNFELYRRAFIHKSYIKRPFLENQSLNITIIEKPLNALPLSTKSNERLEFLGDGVLECITKYYLYRRFPKADEGFMTEKKIALVKNEHIGKLAYDMQLHNYYIISKHAEEKKTRTNLKKLGCLFEAFLGALFLDFNHVTVKDEDKWFEQLFVTGPGFQMAQIFVEKIFDLHVDWTKLLKTDDNYKNQLQVKIQKEFKVTPEYIEISHDLENGYNMGVYLCLGQSIWETNQNNALPFSQFNSFINIQNYIESNEKVLILLGSGLHKIKKKAEQIACEYFINLLNNNL